MTMGDSHARTAMAWNLGMLWTDFGTFLTVRPAARTDRGH